MADILVHRVGRSNSGAAVRPFETTGAGQTPTVAAQLVALGELGGRAQQWERVHRLVAGRARQHVGVQGGHFTVGERTDGNRDPVAQISGRFQPGKVEQAQPALARDLLAVGAAVEGLAAR